MNRFTVGSVVLGVVLAASACTGGEDAAAPDRDASPASAEPSSSMSAEGTVISPGRPGEAASTGPVDPVAPAPWNDADTAFVRMMVPHHAQALEMTALAEQHATDSQVRRLAQRISAAQGPEIATMSGWLAERDLEADPDMAGMAGMSGMSGMSGMGMLTPDQLTALGEARGADFDRLFLTGMIRHHQGAVDMATAVAEDGSDVLVGELAADVSLTQTAEIARMREMLAG